MLIGGSQCGEPGASAIDPPVELVVVAEHQVSDTVVGFPRLVAVVCARPVEQLLANRSWRGSVGHQHERLALHDVDREARE
jgi:hypothetical protein